MDTNGIQKPFFDQSLSSCFTQKIAGGQIICSIQVEHF